MVYVSVIVPIYNVEKYLGDCLESLLHQTLKNIEVLLVNDGTKDNSGIIAKKYADKYPQLFKYLEKENGGLSDARNFAIPYAKGKYLAFVDSDDYVAAAMFEKLYNLAEANNADMVDCEFEYVYEESGKHKRVSFPTYKSKYDCLINLMYNSPKDYGMRILSSFLRFCHSQRRSLLRFMSLFIITDRGMVRL